MYKGYMIDLDGTMYKGSEKIEEAIGFVKRLKEKKIPYLFVTNNSTKTPAQVADKLLEFDIPAHSEQVFTTAMATAMYISEQKQNAKVYVIGEEGLRVALEEGRHELVEENPDFVVSGLDRSINYEKLTIACLGVRNGATFISTNGDIALPTERGFLPGNGSLTSVITVSTQTEPIFIGKPESIIMAQALEVMGLRKEEVVMVGDNYDTDILAGIRFGMDTLMVFTGVTSKEELSEKQIQPTHSVDSLADWKI